MTLRLIDTRRKLAEVERVLIEQRTQGRDVSTLSEVAKDLRAQMEGQPHVAFDHITRAVADAHTGERSPKGYDPEKMLWIARTVLRHWPAVRQALEQFKSQPGSQQ